MKGEGVTKRNEKVFASVKPMPFLLNNREFLFKNIYRKNHDKSIQVATNSMP
eukprot:CAMPEP_0118670222 /NCGR_PEP_ID=MMETSP0785-20121206/21336_1 /TAXON_ID=91992 /ORGANISM="Bolidomonas pacifica, Strain CCMP 1866" /LENGTH=51 /DNA_ID=CAMNT_0006564991 /DNA_START=59 /DNA_END=211 /DNA_ORIENTATION=-